jgi:AcrR family transcriptional regulator
LAWEARALGLLAQDSTLTVAEIARRVGMHRRTLYRSSKFKAALKARSAAGRMHRLVQGTTLATAAAPEDDTRPVARNSRPRPGRHNY